MGDVGAWAAGLSALVAVVCMVTAILAVGPARSAVRRRAVEVAYNARAIRGRRLAFWRRGTVNGLTLVALIALVIGIGVAYRAGAIRARRAAAAHAIELVQKAAVATGVRPQAHAGDDAPAKLRADPERAQLLAFAEERRGLFGQLADARAETARYRQVVIDIERDAPPPLLDAPGTPDDLKMIVGVGPVIERMLHQMGIASYRQLARLTERGIDDLDARLPEFPGRIRRDGWVTQARALHVSKYGTAA